MSKASSSVTLDAFDLAILNILQQDASTPQRVIGEAVNLSAPAVQRRIRRLEEAGVIQAYVAIIDPARVGHPLTIFVEVESISETAEQIDAAKREFSAVPRAGRRLRRGAAQPTIDSSHVKEHRFRRS